MSTHRIGLPAVDPVTLNLAASLDPADEYALTGTLRPSTIEALLDQVADDSEAQLDEVGARIQRCLDALPDTDMFDGTIDQLDDWIENARDHVPVDLLNDLKGIMKRFDKIAAEQDEQIHVLDRKHQDLDEAFSNLRE